MLSPLQLDHFHLERLIIEVSPDSPELEIEAEERSEYQFTFRKELAKHPDHEKYMVLLGITCTHCEAEDTKGQLHLEADVRGFFSLPDDAPEDFIEQVVPLNCYAMLYGLIRGIVAQATGMTRQGTILLPTINLMEALQPTDEPDEAREDPITP